ncbi:MAG TPA: hypothetical protein VGP72_16100 [Planctomycetota bacterium]
MRSGLRQWALLTAFLYMLTLALLTLPLLFAAFWQPTTQSLPRDLTEVGELYLWPWYWAILVGLVLLQAPLLFISVRVARRQRPTRASWTLLAIVSALMVGLIFVGFGFALWDVFGQGDSRAWMPLALGAMAWLVWAVIFSRYAYNKNPASSLRKILDRLIGGSIAELLIAVPCHVYVRHRNDCCAGFGTFLGLATGLSVLLFAFGPGVFFLFVERARRLKRLEEEGETDAVVSGWTSRKVRHTRHAMLWTLGAIIFMMALMVVAAFIKGGQSWLGAARASFVVIGAIAGYHAWRAYLRREPGWRLALAGAIILSESIVAALVWTWK